MAHYAFLDENNIVTSVITGTDEEEGVDLEQVYGDFTGQTCKRTSYNTAAGKHLLGGTPFRKNYAGIGYSYDPQRDAFIPPKPYESWVLDEDTCIWEPPTPRPIAPSGQEYTWDEDQKTWVLL